MDSFDIEVKINNLDKYNRNNVLRRPPLDGTRKVFIQKNKSVPDSIGFKINVGIPSNTKMESDELYIPELREWSVLRRSRKIAITGILTEQNKKVTKNYDAGIILKYIKKDQINTEKGIYYLNGPPQIKNEISKIFYEFWYIAGGFPMEFCKL